MTGLRRGDRAATTLCAFVALVLGVPFLASDYPIRIIAGESSLGTWMSGFLLAGSALLALALGAARGLRRWAAFALFFALLALDERFLVHEGLKTWILLRWPALPPWTAEGPVLVGALAGLVVAVLLRRRMSGHGRILVPAGVLLGLASVAIDVAHLGVLWEEVLKLLAELLVACALLDELAATQSTVTRAESSADERPGLTAHAMATAASPQSSSSLLDR